MFNDINDLILTRLKLFNYSTLIFLILFSQSFSEISESNLIMNSYSNQTITNGADFPFSYFINGSIANTQNLVLISKEVVRITSSCQDNPYLSFLDTSIREKVVSSLYETARNEESQYCFLNKNVPTCCSDKTFDLLKKDMDNWINKKNAIFSSNIGIYYQIVKEHRRNLVSNFNIPNENFNMIFSEMNDSLKEIVSKAENVTKLSLQHKWNSYCNFICNQQYDLCDIYNLTFKFNSNIVFNDLKFECGNFNYDIYLNLQNFFQILNNLNSKISDIYSKIFEKITRENNYLTSTLARKKLMTYSINDGLRASLSNIGDLFCDAISQEYTKTLNKTVSSREFNCENIIFDIKFCIPFNCLDDFIFQLNPFAKKDFKDAYKQIENYYKLKINSTINNSLVEFSESKVLFSNNINWISSTSYINPFYLVNLILVLIFVIL
jgi:hypothetical protein